MRIVQVNVIQPRERTTPEALLTAWPTLRDIAVAVQRAGAEVTVLQSFDRDAELERDGVRFRFVAEPRLPRRLIGVAPWRLANAVGSVMPNVIHLNGLDFALHTRALCRTGIPVLAQDHASTPDARCARRRWGLAKVAGVAFSDARQAEPFVRKGCMPGHVPIFSVPESSTHFSRGDATEARAQFGMHGDPAVLWVGRLDANKDPLTIIDAIERAAPDLPDVQLWCCFHEQPLLAQVTERLARSPELKARVHLLGQLPHASIETLCRAADFFMLGSHREGAGYALLEALACGATPIVSDIAAFRGLTGEGRVGALVPVGDTDGFARALLKLAARPRAELRRSAIEHFERELSFDIVGRRLLEIYATLAGAAK